MAMEGYMQTSPRDFLFHLENVSVNFKERSALKNIQLTIKPSEILFVTGASGAGKTTLLKLLAGDLRPSQGKVFNQLGRTGFIGKVFQDLRLLDDYSCEENLWLAYDSNVYRSRNEFNDDLNQLTQIFGIRDRQHLKIKDCNGGLKQKISIIRSLLARPEILLADEPTSSLDKANANKLYDVLSFYNTKRKLTIVWASHNRELIKQFSGRIVHLNAGKLVHSGHACFI